LERLNTTIGQESSMTRTPAPARTLHAVSDRLVGGLLIASLLAALLF
jgi:hypothetical protein